VQAMSGIMEATGSSDLPLKAGASIADIAGAQTGLFAIVTALEKRDRTGEGSMIDIAMQDVGAWLTQGLWNGPLSLPSASLDPVSVAVALTHPQVVARELVVSRLDNEGTSWEMLGSPMKLECTPATIGRPLGPPTTGPIDWTSPSFTSRSPMAHVA